VGVRSDPVSIHVRSSAKGPRYDVKVRSADGLQHSKTFATKRAAVAYEARQRAALADGNFIAPRAGATTVAELAERWMAAGAKRELTKARNRSALKNHLLPDLGPTRSISRISKADCQDLVDKWSASGLAPRTVARQYGALRAMLQYAVDADLLARNPAAKVKLPLAEAVLRPDLAPEDLEQLAAVMAPRDAAFMWCGAVLGLRWSEAAGLTVSSVDMLGGNVRVTAQLDRQGRLAPPKTRGSVRSLAAPAWLLESLAALLRERELTGADTDAYVFVTESGSPLSYTNWRSRVWVPATTAAGLAGLHFHDLRSVAASALVAAGVDLRTAMHRLGHTTPAMTLAIYARVAADRDRAAADAVSARVAPGRGTGIGSSGGAG
jgi:integrase